MNPDPSFSEAETTREAEHPVIAQLRQDVSLADGARKGGMWLAGGSWATQAFQFAISIVMARLLLPQQFGETALVNAIAGFAIIFTDLGLSAAVIHAQRVTQKLLDTAFWLSALSGIALTLALCGAAFPIASAYGQPQLVGLFIVVSLNFTFQLGAVHLALLERAFHYRRVAFIESIAAVAGLAATPLFVLAGFGVYSVVLGPLVNTTLLSLLLWLNVPWRPTIRFSAEAMRRIWSFSRGLVGFNAINYWARNLDNIMLGAYVSDAELGKYNRSYNLMMIPIGQVGSVLMRGLYPALARMQDEPRRLGRAWIRAIAVSGGAFTLPITLTLAATAPALVRVLYGDRWVGMVPILQLLALAAVPQMIGASSGAPYRAAGKAGLLFRLSLITTASTIVAIVVGVQWGATGVAAALLAKSWINLPIAVLPLAKHLGMRKREVFLPILSSWVPASALFGAELGVRFLLGPQLPAVAVLALQLVLGAGAQGLIVWRSGSETSREMREMMRPILTRFRRPAPGKIVLRDI
jgi:O-antigen/teichoic acid export membrane protein